MYYKDNNIEIRLGLGINEFKSITTNIFSFILSKLNEDDTISYGFVDEEKCKYLHSDGIAKPKLKYLQKPILKIQPGSFGVPGVP